MLESRIIYDKENIEDILDYVLVCLFSRAKQNEQHVYCIEHVNKCLQRIRSNSNFDMSIDTMLFNIREELNENRSRR
jgi:hypothetical protein